MSRIQAKARVTKLFMVDPQESSCIAAETTIRLLQEKKNGEVKQCLHARFVMVSVHPTDSDIRPPILPLICEGEEEQNIFNEGQQAQQRRRQRVTSTLRSAITTAIHIAGTDFTSQDCAFSRRDQHPSQHF